MDRPSPAVQDYLKAIYQLDESAQVAGPVTTTRVAEALGVTTASASNMLKKLDGLGYATQVKRQGVELTATGRQAALEVIRHHRLLELYLAEALGMSWDRVHEEAEVLEHAISPELSELIAAKLGNPTHDPHGDPIPTVDGEIESHGSRPLADLEPGDRGVFVRVSDSDPEMLRWLSERGIAPGDRLEVIERQPFAGPLLVRFASGDHALGGGLVEMMRVEVA